MSPARERLALIGVLMGLAAGAAWMSAALSPAARLVPLGVAAVTMAMLAIELAAPPRETPTAPARRDAAPRDGQEAAMLRWFAALLALVFTAGMAVGLPAYVLIYLRVRTSQTWRRAGGFALVLWFVLSWGLQMALGVRLYSGWLAERMAAR